MSTDAYRININYDNDNIVYILPMNPPDMQVSYKGETSSAEIDRFGEVLYKNRRDAMQIKFESYFPAEYSETSCDCTESEFKDPQVWNDWILQLMDAEGPCHFVVEGSPMDINLYAVITNYSPKEVGGDPGTIKYTLELKEYREPTVSVYTGGGTGGERRPDNSGKSQKMKVSAKTAWFRKKKNGKKIKKLKKGTKVTWDGKKDGSWYHVKYNKKWGYIQKSKLKKA